MSRKVARDTLYKILFASRFYDDLDVKPDFFALLDLANYSKENLEQSDIEYIQTSFNNIMKNVEQLKEQVMAKIDRYSAERIYPADLTALILGVYELNQKDIPPKVVINEIVNLVKKYSTEKSTRFVNGVLGSFVKEKNE